ncbi:MAG TPA: hypothetical protein VNU26_08645 [Mycobacteriales bacterium]|nr:hypothetical protein [Mycobacteriales bacterium]
MAVDELSTTRRWVRTAAFAAGLALLLAGTAWGDDDHFPFGPFRMYSTADDPDGRVLSTYLQAVDTEGRVVERVGEHEVGLRRAEYEGQLSRVVDDPQLLGDLAETFSRRHPDRPPWAEVRVVQTAYVLVDGVPTDEKTEVLAEWTAP